MVAQTTASLVTQGIPTLGPFIQKEFNLTRTLLGIIIALINIGSVFTLAVAGKIVDRFGEKLAIGIGGTLVGLTIMGMVFANTIYSVLVLVFISGLWYASATPGGSKAIMIWFPERQRGMAMGIRQTGIPLGGMLAAVILSPLATWYGWRFALFIAGFVAILGSAIWYIFYKEPAEQNRTRNRRISSIGTPLSQILFNPNFICISLFSIALAISQSASISYLILFSMEVLNLSLATGSYLLALTQMAGVLGRIMWGVLSDRCFHGKRQIILAAILLMSAAATLMLAFLSHNSPFWLIVIVIVLMGFSSIGWNGMFITYVSELGGHENTGSAVGLALTASQIGFIVGPPLFGLLVDISNSYRVGWATLSGLLWASLVLFKFFRDPLPAASFERV
jgi:sugar phosphate permease